MTATNTGGRATFQNAGRTRREGFELSWLHETLDHWRTQLAYTWLDAALPRPLLLAFALHAANRWRQATASRASRGNALFAAFGWCRPMAGARAPNCARWAASRPTTRNSASAAGYALVALHAGYLKRWERWEFNAFARVDNLLDRRYVGSVIVNEGNGRYLRARAGPQLDGRGGRGLPLLMCSAANAARQALNEGAASRPLSITGRQRP